MVPSGSTKDWCWTTPSECPRLRLTCDSDDFDGGSQLHLKIKQKTGGCCGGSRTIAEEDIPLSAFILGGGSDDAHTHTHRAELHKSGKKAKGSAANAAATKRVAVDLVYAHPGRA